MIPVTTPSSQYWKYCTPGVIDIDQRDRGAGDIALIEVLWRQGNLPSPRQTNGHSSFETRVYWLLSHGANIDLSNDSGETALRMCIRFNLHELLRAILAIGTKSSACVLKNGSTLLHAAAAYSDVTTLDILYRHALGIFQGALDKERRSAIDYAQARWKNDASWTELNISGKPILSVSQMWYDAFCSLYEKSEASHVALNSGEDDLHEISSMPGAYPTII